MTAITNTAQMTTTKATTTANSRRKHMRFSASWWAFWAGVWAVGLTAAAAIAGIVAWYFSNLASAETDARTGTLELRVAEQQERAANAERELLALREKLAPRQISADHKSLLIAALKTARAKGPISLLSVIGDGEALAYRTAIELILRTADWPVVEVNEAQLKGPGAPIGIAIAVRNPGAPPESAEALFDAFRQVGIHPQGVMDPRIGHDVVRVLIHHKPQ